MKRYGSIFILHTYNVTKNQQSLAVMLDTTRALLVR